MTLEQEIEALREQFSDAIDPRFGTRHPVALLIRSHDSLVAALREYAACDCHLSIQNSTGHAARCLAGIAVSALAKLKEPVE